MFKIVYIYIYYKSTMNIEPFRSTWPAFSEKMGRHEHGLSRRQESGLEAGSGHPMHGTPRFETRRTWPRKMFYPLRNY